MSKFVVIPKYRNKENVNVRYDAPAFFIEANDGKEAEIIAKEKSGLSRFPEWFFYITGEDYLGKHRHNAVAPKRNSDKNSKSQIGKTKTGHDNSRPLRRALKRLSSKANATDGGRKGGAMKMW